MLERLELRAFGPIEHLCLDLEPGFIAVTGETGAGKSVLLGALRFLAGGRSGRSERSLIPAGKEQAWAQAVFRPTALMQAFLDEQGLAPCEEDQLFITRTVCAKGPGKAYLNGHQVPVSSLQALGPLWIDFHDPSAPKACFDPKEQLRIVDTFGGIDSQAYREAYEQLQACKAEHDKLTHEERLDATALKRIEQTLERMGRLDLSDAAIEALEAQSKAIDQARVRQEHAYGLYQALETQALEAFRQKASSAQALGQTEASCAPLATRWSQLQIEIQDLAQEAYQASQEAAHQLQDADRVEVQLEQWFSLKHAHGGSPEAVRHKQAQLQAQLEVQSSLDGRLLELEHTIKQHEAACWEAARHLSAARTKAAATLQKQVAHKLAVLGLEHATLNLQPCATQSLGPRGADTLSFLFAPNPGHPPQPLQAIASSGESARVHLALTAVLAQQEATPVLVFDEVDANVGGEIARHVGQELAALGRAHQVLCITHLPQVASQAAQHYCVDKSHEKDTTQVTLRALHPHPQARKDELARMLGDRRAPAALQHAQALMEQ